MRACTTPGVSCHDLTGVRIDAESDPHRPSARAGNDAAGKAAHLALIALVPKLHLGMPVSPKLCFAFSRHSTREVKLRQRGIPKRSLETRQKSFCRAGRRNQCLRNQAPVLPVPIACLSR